MLPFLSSVLCVGYLLGQQDCLCLQVCALAGSSSVGKEGSAFLSIITPEVPPHLFDLITSPTVPEPVTPAGGI